MPFAGKSRLSLCVIARDEAHNLPRLLRSAAPWVAETVLVDTGSVDDTETVARGLGARVEKHPWEQSFSLARNRSLDLAQTPWALILDADEELVVTDPAGFAHALCEEGPVAFAIDCHDLHDDGSVAVAPLLRLFRRDLPDMRFAGAVHEQLIAVARGRVQVARAPFAYFRHDGHTTRALQERNKDARNLQLARRQQADNPHDAFAWFCLGQALLTVPTPQRVEEACAAYEQAQACLGAHHRGESFVVPLHTSLALTQRQLGKPDAALATLDAGLASYPDSPDLRLARAQRLMERGRLLEAEADLRVCLSPGAAAFFVRLDPGASGHGARTQLGLCLLRQARLQEAAEELRRAGAEAPPGEELARVLLAKVEAHLRR